MRMRAVFALVLGALTAVVIGCGSGSSGTIPKSATGKVKDHLDSVAAAVRDKDCGQVPSRITALNSDITNLRDQGVPDELLRNLRQGVAQLATAATKDCAPAKTESVTTDTTPTETLTDTVPTDTAPTDTVPQDTVSTDTGPVLTDGTEPPSDTTGGAGTGGATPPGPTGGSGAP